MKRLFLGVAVVVILLVAMFIPYDTSHTEGDASFTVSVYREENIPYQPGLLMPCDYGVAIATHVVTEKTNFFDQLLKGFSMASDDWWVEVSLFQFDRNSGEYVAYGSTNIYLFASDVTGTSEAAASTFTLQDITVEPGVYQIFITTYYKVNGAWNDGGAMTERFEVNNDFAIDYWDR